jgi:hypothetical protein
MKQWFKSNTKPWYSASCRIPEWPQYPATAKWLAGFWLTLLVLLYFGCSTAYVPTTGTDKALESPPSRASTSPPPTLSVTPTLESRTVPTPTPIDCAVGIVMFASYRGENNTPTGYYGICADSSLTYKVTRPDPWLFSRNVSPADDLWVRVEGTTLVITDRSDQEITRLLDDDPDSSRVSNPTWSPDGEYIAYIRHMEGPDGFPWSRVEVVHVATGIVSRGFIPADESEWLDMYEAYEWIEWSPAANQILLYSRQQPLHLARVSCDNSSYICTADVRAIGVRFGRKMPFNAWSPDGEQIAYPCYSTTTTGVLIHEALCIQDTDGNMIAELPEPELGVIDINYLAWAPDSTRIAFVAYPAENHRAEVDLFVLSLSDMSLINLTSDPYIRQGPPVWIP